MCLNDSHGNIAQLRNSRDAIEVEHVLCVGPSKPATPAGDYLVEQMSWRVSWFPANHDQAEAGRQSMDATQGELVPKHNDGERTQHGAGADGSKVCFVKFSRLVCGGCHVEDAGKNGGGGRPLETSPRRNLVVRLLTVQASGRNRGR